MVKYREILRLHSQGMSKRNIAASCGCSRNTITSVLDRASVCDISWPLSDEVTDGDLQAFLFPEKFKVQNHRMPDYEYVHKELAKKGVALTLLWEEYCRVCYQAGETPYMYTQFCFHYRKYANTTKATLRIKRKPGELMEVDWAGQTAFLKNNTSGEKIPAYIFVATLPCSQYTYVEAFLAQNLENWITAHMHAFNFYEGVTSIIVPDNLRTGVDRSNYWDPKINRSYYEMAEYYGTAVVPARVRQPKDKASVEGNVGVVSTWIIAALRNETFFSLKELNQAIQIKLKEFNEKPFQKKTGSRQIAFYEEEKFALLPLPFKQYELATWKTATVPLDYHIVVDEIHYSVPYEYVKHKVDIRVTTTMVEIFFKHLRIASHMRKTGLDKEPSTVPEHMPDNHRMYLEWDKAHIFDWADKVGSHTKLVMESIFKSYRVERQAQKMCMGIVKLADRYSLKRLEEACRQALTYSPSPRLNSIKTILKQGTDKNFNTSNTKKANKPSGAFGFTRGAEYFGGKQNDK
ncbi:IS21 family transposase [Halobacillus sp. A1]|uniref:IS21 family transposase n=1 Tax=Halobacillus sp. A1 TaxID=2880262 RepID=UPI0020A6BE6E|nr:IS21 family transposase [Halobacillus sp. A1]MCP3033580.1 IS21 family transposase [Halobacillus sp. A1]